MGLRQLVRGTSVAHGYFQAFAAVDGVRAGNVSISVTFCVIICSSAVCRFVATKDAMECVLLFVLIGQKNALLALMRANKGSESTKKFQEFLACDSDDPEFRARACKNAFRLICQHRYALACALFLLANDIGSAMDVAANRLGDIMLAVAIARLHSKDSSVTFSQEHELFISER